MSAIPFDSNEMGGAINHIGSIHVRDAKGNRYVVPFKKLESDEQENIVKLITGSSSLSAHFEKQRASFNIVYREEKERSVVVLAGKEIKLGEISDFQEAAESDREESVADVLNKVQAYSEPIGAAADGLSFFRNTISAVFTQALANAHSKTSIAVNGLGIVGGAAGVAGGSIAISKGVQKMANPKEEEEFNLGVFQTIFGTGYLGVGITSILYRASSLVESASSLSQKVLTCGLNPTLFVMNAGLALMGLYKMTIAGSFRSELNQAIEQDGARGGIELLCKNLFLTDEEKKRVESLSEEKRAEETKKILDRKREHLERRIGEETVKEIAPKVEALKHGFDNGYLDSESIASGVLERVSKGNYQEIAKALMLIALAVLGIVSITAVGPTGTFVFFAALAILWFIADCSKTSDFTTEQLWKLHQLLMGVLSIAADGVDTEFMDWLCSLDPDLRDADDEVRANAYLNARTELGGGIYDMYRKAKEAPEFLLAMEEIRKASFDCNLDTKEARLDALCSAMPNFYELMAKEHAHLTIEEILDEAYQELSPEEALLPKEIQLKLVSLYLLNELYDFQHRSESSSSATIPSDGHPDRPSRLSRSSPL